MLRSDDDAEAARQALREIDAAPEEAVPVLVEILQDEKASRQSRFYAMFLIRKAGPAAKQALPVLRKMLEEAEGRQREGLQRTIDEIDK
jgi:HEAT repeat protein